MDAVTGEITGVPEEAGTFNVTLTAACGGQTTSVTKELTGGQAKAECLTPTMLVTNTRNTVDLARK
jgi:hypothetical protein